MVMYLRSRMVYKMEISDVKRAVKAVSGRVLRWIPVLFIGGSVLPKLSRQLVSCIVMGFKPLRYCGTAAMILAELSGNISFRFWKDQDRDRAGHSRVLGFFALFVGQFLLSCLRIVPMLLPFVSGFLGCYEKDMMNLGTFKQLGRKRVQLMTLFFTTSILFFPALINMLVFEAEGGSISIMNLGWLLANTVLFGVLLNEWYNDDMWVNPRDSEREFLITFVCTLVLELVYFPELSLWGLLICGFLLWVAIRQLNWAYAKYVELGTESSENVLFYGNEADLPCAE
ncbi:1-deoxy-D-xylulose-5-phosphate synthase [Bienertia sinuspersici]